MWGGIWEGTAPRLAAEHGVQVRRFGPVQATACSDLPETPWINLVLGAAAPGAVEDGSLAAAVGWLAEVGIEHYVPVTPGLADSARAQRWLESNGYRPGYGWMKFVRDTSPPEAPPPSGPEVVELGNGEGAAFASIVAEGFGLPAWAAGLFAELPGRDGWRCYLASVDGEPAGTAAMVVEDGIAELGFAATLAPARGMGCQNALLHRRIVDAGAAGCHTLLVETGERLPDRPSASYRNILRAGFAEAYPRPNWQQARD